jgi:hypothetical protein
MKGMVAMIIRPLAIPLSITGFAVAGLALGAGWKIGCFLADLATGDRTIDLTFIKEVFNKRETEEPLWKRQFNGVTEE